MSGVTLAILAMPKGSVTQNDRSKYTSASGTPGPRRGGGDQRTASPVTGDAPWALSALPGCFRQLYRATGSRAFAHPKFPRGARRLAPNARLRAGDCTLDIYAASAVVTRGENRLSIPPLTRFYAAGGHLVLDRLDAGREDIRTYAVRGGLGRALSRPPGAKP